MSWLKGFQVQSNLSHQEDLQCGADIDRKDCGYATAVYDEAWWLGYL
jgi:hypothetical protein